MLITNNQQPTTLPRRRAGNTHLSGFTLIEILVVIGILGIVISLGTSMFFWVLKGSSKSQAVAEVKQSGNYALNVMERMIRNAQELTDYTDTDGDSIAESITIENPDGGLTTFVCGDIGGETTIASVAASLLKAGVEVQDDCDIFTIEPGVAGVRPARVDIDFTLAKTDSAVKYEDQAEVAFRTSVTLRNY